MQHDVLETFKGFIKENAFNGSMDFIMGLIEDDGSLSIYERLDQPCYGELRSYGPDDLRPDDLTSPFPETGAPTYLGIPFVNPTAKDRDTHNRIVKTLFGTDTTYRRGLSSDGFILVEDEEGWISGLIQLSGNFDPTVLVAGLIYLRNIIRSETFPIFREHFPYVPDQLLVLLAAHTGYYPSHGFIRPKLKKYYVTEYMDLKRFVSGDTLDITGGTWGDRYDYNRTDLHTIFGDTGTSLNDMFTTHFGNTDFVQPEEALPKIKEIFNHLLKLLD